MTRVRVAIVEDNKENAQRIEKMVKKTNRFDVDFIVDSVESLQGKMATKEYMPVIFLIDMSLKTSKDGIHALEYCKKLAHKPKIVIISADAPEFMVNATKERGASAYIRKNVLFSQEHTLEGVLNALHNDYAKEFIDETKPKIDISDEQKKAIKLLKEGKRLKDIGQAIDKSATAVGNMFFELRPKFAVETNAQLVTKATELGLV